MSQTSQPTLTTSMDQGEVRKAARELDRMSRSLKAWLAFRLKNDAIAAGKTPAKISPTQAQHLFAQTRDMSVEQRLADRLYALLSEVVPDTQLPLPDVSQDPNAAAKLALIAIQRGSAQAATPQAQGMMVGPWSVPWPVLVVGGLLILGVVAIRTYADVAKEQERTACIKAGACTDYGFWLKAAGMIVVGWFVWEKVGVGAAVKRHVDRIGTGHGRKSLPASKR